MIHVKVREALLRLNAVLATDDLSSRHASPPQTNCLRISPIIVIYFDGPRHHQKDPLADVSYCLPLASAVAKTSGYTVTFQLTLARALLEVLFDIVGGISVSSLKRKTVCPYHSETYNWFGSKVNTFLAIFAVFEIGCWDLLTNMLNWATILDSRHVYMCGVVYRCPARYISSVQSSLLHSLYAITWILHRRCSEAVLKWFNQIKLRSTSFWECGVI